MRAVDGNSSLVEIEARIPETAFWDALGKEPAPTGLVFCLSKLLSDKAL